MLAAAFIEIHLMPVAAFVGIDSIPVDAFAWLDLNLGLGRLDLFCSARLDCMLGSARLSWLYDWFSCFDSGSFRKKKSGHCFSVHFPWCGSFLPLFHNRTVGTR
jgi:hypothetical protein